VQMAKAAGVRSFALATGACSARDSAMPAPTGVGPDLRALAACLLRAEWF
jgi:hypothetical protein